MTEWSDDQHFATREGLVREEVEDEVVVLDLSNNVYFGLNAVGHLVWQHVEDGASLGEVVDANAVDRGPEFRDHIDQEIVSERALEGLALDRELHRLCLIGADKDGDQFFAGPEDDDGRAGTLLADAHTDPLNRSLVFHSLTYGAWV